MPNTISRAFNVKKCKTSREGGERSHVRVIVETFYYIVIKYLVCKKKLNHIKRYLEQKFYSTLSKKTNTT